MSTYDVAWPEQTQTNERNTRSFAPKKKTHLPTSNRASFFPPRNKPLTLKQTFIPKGKKNKSLSLQHDCTSRKKPVKDPDNSRRQRVTWFILSKGRKIFSLGKGGRGNKINKNLPFLCVFFNSRFLPQLKKQLPFLLTQSKGVAQCP